MRLPEKKHFMKDGIFSQSHLRSNNSLPVEILEYIFPGYVLGNRHTIKKKTLKRIENYCIFLQKLAKREDEQHRQAEIKRLEEAKAKKEKMDITLSIASFFPYYLGGCMLPDIKRLCNLKNVNSKSPDCDYLNQN